METSIHPRISRGRGSGVIDAAGVRTLPSKNKQWVPDQGGNRVSAHSESERWERGGHYAGRSRGSMRGTRKFQNVSLTRTPRELGGDYKGESHDVPVVEDPDPSTPDEREKFYQELVKAREVERKKAIAEGKMDDPLIPKRLEDAITMVGTCMDMCPRFERYRRERENNLFEWETIPGTKRVDHRLAVKMYERAAGDKTLPSDLRPPVVLKRTLDYLFHDLLPRGGFSQTFNFIRDRSRAVRNDFTMQHDTGPLAIECHDRCARLHILALHLERDRSGFSIALEEQQLMNTLQSLKEFYEDQRGRYESPTELEMRVYHRLVHIRDQKERHEDIPLHITDHPVFKLTTKFRQHVQAKSTPISKVSPLVVDDECMQIFVELAAVLRDQGSVVMVYLVACILERLFGKETIDNIEAIRGDLSIPNIIDGISVSGTDGVLTNGMAEQADSEMVDDLEKNVANALDITSPLKPSATAIASKPTASTGVAEYFQPPTSTFRPSPMTSTSMTPPVSVFSSLASTPNGFNTSSVFGTFSSSSTSHSASGGLPNPIQPAFGRSEASSPTTSLFDRTQSRNSFSPSTPLTLPKINTNPFSTNPGYPPTTLDSFPTSPQVPPPLKKQQPISLPPTPSTSRVPSTKSMLDLVKNGLLTSTSSPSGILSPLYLSPTTSRQPSFVNHFTDTAAPTSGDLNRTASSNHISDSKGRSPASSKGKEPVVDLDAKALAFTRKGILVKECFDRWQKQTTDKAAWVEACRHGDAYREKAQLQRLSQGPAAEKKRRIASSQVLEISHKRVRHVSREYKPPRTDEELAQRFKENHKERERRWAKGSFLEVTRTYIQKTGSFPSGWRIWLSTNPENDGTAIWLERKFDVPASGQWESDNVFAIPLSPNDATSFSSPGVIIFECTPLEGVTDELERKFRILEDCARLRSVVKALPRARHFIVSLLVLFWATDKNIEAPSDLVSMINTLIQEAVLESYHVFSITSSTQDLDQKFCEALDSLAFDLGGKLVKSFTIADVFKLLEPPWNTFLSERLDKCAANGGFDWILYGRTLEALVDIFNQLAHHVLGLIDCGATYNPLSSIDAHDITDTKMAYEVTMAWLASVCSGESGSSAIMCNLQSYKDMGLDFPSTDFIGRLSQLVQHRIESHIGKDHRTQFHLLKAEIASTLEGYQRVLQSHAARLQQAYTLSMRRSPKRRCGSEESGASSTPYATKRLKLSSSTSSNVSDELSPTPSPHSHGRCTPSLGAPTASTEHNTIFVTVDMLRALTKGVKEKYRHS